MTFPMTTQRDTDGGPLPQPTRPSSAGWRKPLDILMLRLFGYLPPEVRHNQFADLFAGMAFGPWVAGLGFIPVVLRNLGAPAEWLAFYAAQPFMGFVVAPWLALLLPHHWGHKRTIVTNWILSRGSFLLIGLVAGWPGLVAVTAVYWTLEAVPSPYFARFVQAVFPVDLRGRVLANTRIALSLVALVVTPMLGALLDLIGYRALFPILAVCGLASTLLFTRVRLDESRLPSSRPSQNGVTRVLRNDRRFVWYLVALALFGLGWMSIAPLLPLVQVDQLHLSYTEIGALTTVSSISALGAFVVLGYWIDRAGGVRALRWVFVLGAIVPICYALANSVWLLVPAFAAFGIVNAGLDLATLTAVIQLCDPEDLGSYFSLQVTVVGLRGLVAPFIGVSILRAGLPMAWTFVGAAVLIGISFLILSRVRASAPSTVDAS